MKRLDLFEGGHKFRIDDLIHMQDGYRDNFYALCEGLGLGNTSFIINGCQITAGTEIQTYNIAAGWIYYYNGISGEIYPCDAVTNLYIPGANHVKWKVVEEVFPYDGYPDSISGEVLYKDGFSHNVHMIKKMVPTGDMTGEIDGNTVKTLQSILVGGIIPKHGVIMYAGPADAFSPNGTGKQSTSDPTIDLTGWHLCNGQSVSGYVTPDLRKRFIAGWDGTSSDDYGAGSGWAYANKSTIGKEKVTLVKANLPPHCHALDSNGTGTAGSTNSTHYHAIAGKKGSGNPPYPTIDLAPNNPKEKSYTGYPPKTADGSHTHTVTLSGRTTDNYKSEMQSTPIENRPPYWVLAFIVKI